MLNVKVIKGQLNRQSYRKRDVWGKVEEKPLNIFNYEVFMGTQNILY